MNTHPYHSYHDLSSAIRRDRLHAAKRAAHIGALQSGTDPLDRPSLRRSVGLTLINVGLRIIPDSPIRGPSTATPK